MFHAIAVSPDLERGYVVGLLAAPDMHLTRIHSSKLWHLAALELWLQRNVDAAAA